MAHPRQKFVMGGASITNDSGRGGVPLGEGRAAGAEEWPGRANVTDQAGPGSREGCPDLADRLAAAEHGHIGDLAQGVAVHALVTIHAKDAQQRHRDGWDRPG